jgi:hypothetical protein
MIVVLIRSQSVVQSMLSSLLCYEKEMNISGRVVSSLP